MPDPMLLGLLVAAIAIGWWLGRLDVKHHRQHRDSSSSPALTRNYFVGLNYLLNEQPDQAIETFVQTLEVNSETIDTHIALGNLFRLRGETDRAVKIHQNLLARPSLTEAQSSHVQLELARDFLKLGLLDRAERLLIRLIRSAHDDDIRRSGKRLLIDLFEREKEWQKALDIAQPQLIRHDQNIRRAAAHWLCELAEEDIANGSVSLARKRLRQALNIDEKCVRTNWLFARMEHHTGQYRNEIRILKRIREQDADFTPITLGPISTAYQMLDDEQGLIEFLQEQIDHAPYISSVLMLAEHLRTREGINSAIDLVSSHLQHYPSLRGVDYLTDLYLKETVTRPHDHDRIELLKRHTSQLLDKRPRHRCERCGFTASQLYWHCPQCRSWGMVKPITGLEGE
ncbi:lipopolysaccharide assembly protein LapB [Phytohalomonas tamaricis]|uniref:lipopolysaccharide assembly protein LapB n=1 Tax=Phytohalomonas tamaricis TaxID=2081032 RepID=UPI000D0B8E52|nr:lipopolysaccharide assembly protein LapB [Phytohalomonas tamaricis]